MNDDQAKLRDLIKDIRIGMLTTVDEEGALRSRPMALQQAGDENLWFFTRAHGGLVGDVQTQDRHVNVAFSEPRDNRYVSVSGTARLVRDPARMRELWTEQLRTWFPDGLDDPELSLLCVTPTKAEYWDTHSRTMLHVFGYVKARLTGESPHGGDHKKVSMH